MEVQCQRELRRKDDSLEKWDLDGECNFYLFSNGLTSTSSMIPSATSLLDAEAMTIDCDVVYLNH